LDHMGIGYMYEKKSHWDEAAGKSKLQAASRMEVRKAREVRLPT
jgi:hypothetical protein